MVFRKISALFQDNVASGNYRAPIDPDLIFKAMNKRISSLGLSKNFAHVVTACCLTVMLISQTAQGGDRTLESVLRNDPVFSIFTNAMDIINFWEHLPKEGSVTLFVPTDQALEAEGSDFLLKSVLIAKENWGRLEELISLHITTDPDPLSITSGYLRTLSDGCLSIIQIGSAVKVGPEAFVLSSIEIGNNLRLITIDRLLIPNYLPIDECTQILSVELEN